MSFLSNIVKTVTGADILGFAGGLLSSNSTNKANSALSAQSIAFEREKAQNAHQWEVEDLRKAGLNPILSAGGSGASTGSPTLIPSGESPFSKGLSNALALRSAQENIRKLKLDNDFQQFMIDGYKDASMEYTGVSKDGIPEFRYRNYFSRKLSEELSNTAKTGLLLSEQIGQANADKLVSQSMASVYGSEFGPWLVGLRDFLPMFFRFGGK